MLNDFLSSYWYLDFGRLVQTNKPPVLKGTTYTDLVNSKSFVVPTEKTFTATQGQTVFTDTSTLPTYIQVFVNGIKLRPTSDFTKSGTQLTLVSAATAGDEIDIVRFD